MTIRWTDDGHVKLTLPAPDAVELADAVRRHKRGPRWSAFAEALLEAAKLAGAEPADAHQTEARGRPPEQRSAPPD